MHISYKICRLTKIKKIEVFFATVFFNFTDQTCIYIHTSYGTNYCYSHTIKSIHILCILRIHIHIYVCYVDSPRDIFFSRFVIGCLQRESRVDSSSVFRVIFVHIFMVSIQSIWHVNKPKCQHSNNNHCGHWSVPLCILGDGHQDVLWHRMICICCFFVSFLKFYLFFLLGILNLFTRALTCVFVCVCVFCWMYLGD